MTRLTIIMTILSLTLSTQTVRADSWTDPEWKKMIYSSDVIALVEYISEGDFRAKAKPLTIYKGQLNTNEIWISGFSNRFGPIDKMNYGDRYIVFLNYHKPTDKTLQYWQKQIKDKPELTSYYEGLKEGKAYYVWSPTSGDLKVKRKKIQYDLLKTSYNSKQSFYPLAEFETFLRVSTKTNKSEFHKEILKKIINSTEEKRTTQYLMMLNLTSFTTFDPIFKNIANEQKPEPCYALAQLLGEIEDEKSRDILVQLLDHQNSIVQGEVVRQLSNQDSQYIGPILLAHLDTAGENGIYPSNLMDPVRNSIDGGKIEIIKTLGKLKYKPAAKVLLSLLDTEDEYLFKLVINVLIELESKDYIPNINEHLKKKTKPLIFDICRIIAKNDLKECKSALMDFISTHNRNDHTSYEYTISNHMGLAHFDDPKTIDFLLSDFENLLTNNDSINSRTLLNWTREYIETFKNIKSTKARPLIYKSLFKWFGLNQDFAVHPELFEIKRNLEDSINQKSLTVLKGHKIDEIQTIVFINNTEKYNNNFTPSYDQIILIKLKPTKLSLDRDKEIWTELKDIKEKISEKLKIPMAQISSRSGFYVSNLDDRFDVDIDWSPMNQFYKYAKELPNMNDLLFLKMLSNNGFAEKEFDKKQLDKTITEIEDNIKK